MKQAYGISGGALAAALLGMLFCIWTALGNEVAFCVMIEEAVEFRNELFVRANHPADKKNKSLVRKHYAQMRRDMMSRVDAMFEKLSGICK